MRASCTRRVHAPRQVIPSTARVKLQSPEVPEAAFDVAVAVAVAGAVPLPFGRG